MAELCVMFYFPTWFEIKHKSNVSDGFNLFFNMVQKARFSHGQVKKIAMVVLQRNAYFAHPENLVLGMLCDEDEGLCRIAVNKIQCIRKNSHYQCQIIKYQDSEASSSQSNDSSRLAIQKFILPKLNVKTKDIIN